MPSLHHAAVAALLAANLASASVQLDFKKERRWPQSNQNQRRADNGSLPVTLSNAQSALLYLVNVTVGTPPQSFALQLDTGSSDTWIPTQDSSVCQRSDRCENGAFDPGSSSTFNLVGEDEFSISYVDGTEIDGDFITDNFGIGGISVKDLQMGVANTAKLTDDVSPFQGILAVGFASGEALADDPSQIYPNIINLLKDQGHMDTLAYSLWLNDLDSSTGSILFGGIDKSKYQGELTILPIQPDSDTHDLSTFTVVLDNMNVESGSNKVQYSRNSLAMPVVLDSGTTLTYLPNDLAEEIAEGVGATSSETAGVFVPCDLQNSPATFNFGFGSSKGPKITIDISEFVIAFPPQPDGGPAPTLQDGTPICQWGILGADGGPNLFGDTFLRSAYVVYDLENKQIGLAQTVFNTTSSDDSDVSEITNDSKLPGASSTATGKVVTQTFTGFPDDPSAVGGSRPSATGDVGGGESATFDLSGTKTVAAGAASGSGGSGGSGSAAASSSNKGVAAGMVTPPSTRFVGVVTVGIVLVSGISGALMVLL